MSYIEEIRGRMILDSRGNPTIEAEVLTEEGAVGRASVPSGASCGEYEACELRDNNPNLYCGKSVWNAIEGLHNEIAVKLEKKYDVSEQVLIDETMIQLDGTENKSRLGANSILAVSMACARAAAAEAHLPLYRYLGGVNACRLPVPLMNVVNGGMHANNGLDFQEFMIVPHGFHTFSIALRAGVEIFHALKKILAKQGYSTSVGDEGGFAPAMTTPQAVLDVLCQAVEVAGYKLGIEVSLALDVAASSFYKNGFYHLRGEANTEQKSSTELVSIYKNLISQYPIVSIEDGLSEDDWMGWRAMVEQAPIQWVGDDLFVTNPKRLKRGIDHKTANAILIKLNQIGTVTETLRTVEMAKSNGFNTVISHRSGETEDTFIADLAVATGSGQIKTGSASRTDRIAKYNQLLRIEEDLGRQALFTSPFSSL